MCFLVNFCCIDNACGFFWENVAEMGLVKFEKDVSALCIGFWREKRCVMGVHVTNQNDSMSFFLTLLSNISQFGDPFFSSFGGLSWMAVVQNNYDFFAVSWTNFEWENLFF